VPVFAFLLGRAFSHAVPPPTESFWGAREFSTQRGHLRYLLLFPPHYDPHRSYELWLNMHGSPGCASQAIHQYREEAQRREVFLLAPQGNGETHGIYIRPDGRRDAYHLLDTDRDRDRFLAVLDEVTAKYPIDRHRIALLGFSAGCTMGWRVLAVRPTTFYFFGGVANGFRQGRPPAPATAEGLRRAARHVPHLYAAGRDDHLAGPLFQKTAQRLREYGFELRTLNPPGVGHELPPVIKAPLLQYMDEVRARK
jgi:poly(3-hydroxybutyrate) depolymerase